MAQRCSHAFTKQLLRHGWLPQEPDLAQLVRQALTVATWGGLTKTQQTSKRCAERGIPDKKPPGSAATDDFLAFFFRQLQRHLFVLPSSKL